MLSFVIEGVHPHDVGTISISEGIAVRTGHHCAQPVMDRFGVPATVRASLAIYNTREDIDALGRRRSQGAEVFALMSDLTDLYQEVILDHNRRPRISARSTTPSHQAEGYNPLCGDRLNLYLRSTARRLRTCVRRVGLRDLESVRLADDRRTKGKTVAEANSLFERFHQVVTTPPISRSRISASCRCLPACASFPSA